MELGADEKAQRRCGLMVAITHVSTIDQAGKMLARTLNASQRLEITKSVKTQSPR